MLHHMRPDLSERSDFVPCKRRDVFYDLLKNYITSSSDMLPLLQMQDPAPVSLDGLSAPLPRPATLAELPVFFFFCWHRSQPQMRDFGLSVLLSVPCPSPPSLVVFARDPPSGWSGYSPSSAHFFCAFYSLKMSFLLVSPPKDSEQMVQRMSARRTIAF